MMVTTDLTVSKAIDEFLQFMGDRRASANTLMSYRNDLSSFRDFHQGEIRDIDTESIRGFKRLLGDKGYAPATVSRKMSAIRSFCSWLLDERLLNHNPAEYIKPGARTVNDIHPLTRSQIRQLRDAPTRYVFGSYWRRDRAMMELMYSTGAKPSEMLRLDLGSFKPDVYGGQLLVTLSKGDDRQRTVRVSEETAGCLLDYVEFGRPELVENKDHCPALFVSRHGCRLTRQGIWLILKGYGELCGIDDIKPSSLRDSRAMHLLMSGASPREVAAFLGVSMESIRRYRASMGEFDG